MPRSLGKMSVYKLFNWRDSAANTIQQTVQAFLELGEAVATRWIQTRKGVMLLQMVPDNNASGAIYVFDRQRDDWYMLSFEGCEDRFTSELFDRVFSEYKLFSYVDQPGLLLSQIAVGSRLTASPCRTPPTAPNPNSQPGGIPCAYPLAASARSRLVTPWPRPPLFPASAPNPTPSPPTANPRLTSSTAGCASPTSPEEPQPRRCFDGPVYAPGRHFFSPANSHPAGTPQI